LKTKDKYILRGRDPIPCDDLLEWATWLETAPPETRQVAHEIIVGEWEISTIFLGLDMRVVTRPQEPHLFETMVFRLRLGERVDVKTGARCSTWEQAEAQHARIAAEFRRAVNS